MWNYDVPQPFGVSLWARKFHTSNADILVLELRLREFFDYTTLIEFSWLNSGLWFASFEVVMHNACWLVLVHLFLYLPVAVTSHVCSMFVYTSSCASYTVGI
jgi:hypothetical protein